MEKIVLNNVSGTDVLFTPNFTHPCAHNCSSSDEKIVGARTLDITTSVATWFFLISFVGAVFGNLLFVVVYVKHSSLRTPFNAYIFNVCLTDLILALTGLPGNFFMNLYGYWPLSTTACTAQLYFVTVVGSGLRCQHLLIAVSRLWAVWWPLQFRQHHTLRVANGMIVGTWLAVHAISLPIVILGRQGIPTAPTEPTCIVHTENLFELALASQFIGFILPECLVLVFSCLVFCLIRKRLTRRNRVGQVFYIHALTHHHTNSDTNLPDHVKGNVESHSSDHYHPALDVASDRNVQSITTHDRVLAYLVTATFICWTPNHVYFTLMRVNGYWNAMYFAVQYCLFYANSWLNPIICYFALYKFRMAINELLNFSK